MIRRFCLDPSAPHNKPLDDIQVELSDQYRDYERVNFLELTLSHEWATEVDYDEEEAKKYGWI